MRILTAEDTVRSRWLYLVRVDEDIDRWLYLVRIDENIDG
jgi:hypothetical protein